MPFSELTLTLAWMRSGGKCECADPTHDHPYGWCRKPLALEARGKSGREGAWEAFYRNGHGGHLGEYLHNCEIRCGECAAPEAEAPGQPIPRSGIGRPGQGRPAGTPVEEEKA